MKIVCISDTHGHHESLEIPEADVLVHAGDIAKWRGSIYELGKFNSWLGTLDQVKHKLIVPGNHDFPFEDTRRIEASQSITHGQLLIDKATMIDGVVFYGSPYQPWFYAWAFNLDRGYELERKWAQIPDQTDVLITHGPPAGILDVTLAGDHVGCEDLLKRIDKIRPNLHVFGHIHESHGRTEWKGITFVNAAVVNRRYELVNPPIVVEL